MNRRTFFAVAMLPLVHAKPSRSILMNAKPFAGYLQKWALYDVEWPEEGLPNQRKIIAVHDEIAVHKNYLSGQNQYNPAFTKVIEKCRLLTEALQL